MCDGIFQVTWEDGGLVHLGVRKRVPGEEFIDENAYILTNTVEHSRDDVETYKYFTAFNYLYSIDNLLDFCKEVTKSFLEDKTTLSAIDIQLFRGNPDEFTKEMNERYYNSIQELLKIIQSVQDSFNSSLKFVPVDYLYVLKGISLALTKEQYRKKGFTTNIFSRIFKNNIIAFLKNKRILRRAFQDTDQYLTQIVFVAETIEKLLSNSSEPYIMHLSAVLRNFEDAGSIEEYLTNCNCDTEPFQRGIADEVASNELVSMLRCNILPIKRMLPPTIRAELSVALHLKGCAADDFAIYTSVLRSFETFNREYYSYFKAVMDEEKSKTKQLENTKMELKRLREELFQKRSTNMHLKEQFQRLRIQKGLDNTTIPDILIRPVTSLLHSDDKDLQSKRVGRKSVSVRDQKKAEEKKTEKKRKLESKKEEKKDKKGDHFRLFKSKKD